MTVWRHYRIIRIRKLQIYTIYILWLYVASGGKKACDAYMMIYITKKNARLLKSRKTYDPIRFVCCAWKNTIENEFKYNTGKLELICVVWVMHKLYQFLLGIFRLPSPCVSELVVKVEPTSSLLA